VVQGLALVLTAVFVLLASRWLGPSGKGLQAVLVSAGQVLALVLSFGVGASMPFVVSSDVRRAPLAARRQARLLAVSAAMLVLAAIANRIGSLAPGLIGEESILIVFTLVSIAQQSYTTLALSAGRIWSFNLSAVIGIGVALGSLFLLLALDRVTPESVVGAQALGLAVASGYVLADLGRSGLLSLRFAEGAQWISQARAAAFGYASGLLTLLMLRIDIFLVTALAGLGAGGIYSVAVAVAELMLRLPHWSSYLLMPIVAEQRLGARVHTVRLFWLSVAFAGGLFVIAVLLGQALESVIVALLGVDFAPVLIVLYATFPRIVFQSGTTILIGNLAGWGYTVYPPAATAVGLVIVTVMDLTLIPEYGLIGAGIAASLAAFGTLLVVIVGFLRLNRMPIALFMPLAVRRGTPSEERTSAG
jgi:O-antigen/teichoic acid export membrane protein